MPHAALWVVQPEANRDVLFVVEFQCRTRLCGWCSKILGNSIKFSKRVSMPHAALWVVQQIAALSLPGDVEFQCRTRLCGWCSMIAIGAPVCNYVSFNAARGFVGGAARQGV